MIKVIGRVSLVLGSDRTDRLDMRSVLPAVFFQHVSQFDDEFSFFVLLAHFESVFILPAQSRFAGFAENVSHGMESSQEDTFLRLTTAHIHDGVEKVRTALTSLKRLGDELIMTGQMRTTMDTAVFAVTVLQVGLKCLTHASAQIRF